VAKKRSTRKRDAVVYVRLPNEDRDRIAEAAAEKGLNVSTYVRMVLVERLASAKDK
jgi:predicted DNA binding CopG/RHH family protein